MIPLSSYETKRPARLAGRPRHETMRGHIVELLRSGFWVSEEDIANEV